MRLSDKLLFSVSRDIQKHVIHIGKMTFEVRLTDNQTVFIEENFLAGSLHLIPLLMQT